MVARCRAKRRTGIPVPDFDRVGAVPMRVLAAGEQKIDRRRGRAAVPHVAITLAEMATFRMRLEVEQPDHIGRGQACCQNLFLRSRISANTFQAGLPERPRDFASSASSARKNGLAAFSAAIVAGMVGLPAARSFATSSARASSDVLFGSMVLAKRILAPVYSCPQ